MKQSFANTRVTVLCSSFPLEANVSCPFQKTVPASITTAGNKTNNNNNIFNIQCEEYQQNSSRKPGSRYVECHEFLHLARYIIHIVPCYPHCIIENSSCIQHKVMVVIFSQQTAKAMYADVESSLYHRKQFLHSAQSHRQSVGFSQQMAKAKYTDVVSSQHIHLCIVCLFVTKSNRLQKQIS